MLNLDSVAELEAHGCADWLLVSQHGGGYDRGAQDGTQISVNAQRDMSTALLIASAADVLEVGPLD